MSGNRSLRWNARGRWWEYVVYRPVRRGWRSLPYQGSGDCLLLSPPTSPYPHLQKVYLLYHYTHTNKSSQQLSLYRTYLPSHKPPLVPSSLSQKPPGASEPEGFWYRLNTRVLCSLLLLAGVDGLCFASDVTFAAIKEFQVSQVESERERGGGRFQNSVMFSRGVLEQNFSLTL